MIITSSTSSTRSQKICLIQLNNFKHFAMALLSSTLRAPLVFSKNPKPVSISSLHSRISLSHRSLRFPSLRFISAAGDTKDAEKPSSNISDDRGEGSEPEAKPFKYFKLPDADPPKDEDEWGKGAGGDAGNGTPAFAVEAPAETEAVDGVHENLEGLKRSLVNTVYGTGLGFEARSEVRVEVSELVAQLEAANPTPAPVEEPDLLNGNWVLLYTASCDLLPLLAAAGSLPLLKLDKISQTIDMDSFTVVNFAKLSVPFASISFSVSASFEVRSPTRIQVTFKEGSLQPQEINIFGQQLSLGSQPQSLNLGLLENEVANLSRVISGHSPLKIPIPERTSSWLITTYLDKDLRISRGDGSFFVLAREGSPFLDQ